MPGPPDHVGDHVGDQHRIRNILHRLPFQLHVGDVCVRASCDQFINTKRHAAGHLVCANDHRKSGKFHVHHQV